MYFITLFEKVEKAKLGFIDFLDRGCVRTVGYFRKKKDAVFVLEHTVADLWEEHYDYAVIEKISEGIYSTSINKYYYKYDFDDCVYKRIKEPELIKDRYSKYGCLAQIG